MNILAVGQLIFIFETSRNMQKAIFIQPSTNAGVAVAICGRTKASTKLKPAMSTNQKLNRMKPTRPSQPAFRACLA